MFQSNIIIKIAVKKT